MGVRIVRQSLKDLQDQREASLSSKKPKVLLSVNGPPEMEMQSGHRDSINQREVLASQLADHHSDLDQMRGHHSAPVLLLTRSHRFVPALHPIQSHLFVLVDHPDRQSVV